MTTKDVLVFDVNETLLDLRALGPVFEGVFGDARLLPGWFAQLLRLAMSVTLIGDYVDFETLAGDALEMVAVRAGLPLTPEAETAILSAMRRLPPHPEVPAALAQLQAHGFRMAALTNSPPHVAEAQIENAGLAPFFERVLSVDAVRRFKPAPEPCRMAARELGVAIGQMRMIAAHDWDVAGALQAGARAAFVARPGMVLGRTLPRPDIIGRDMVEVAEFIISAA